MADVSGPVFHSGPALAQMLEDIRGTVAQRAHDLWRAGMHLRFQHPTGYYESHVIIDHLGPDRVVTDQGVVYGPFLEYGAAAGQRNSFRGYGLAGIATELTEAEVPQLVAPIVDRFVALVS